MRTTEQLLLVLLTLNKHLSIASVSVVKFVADELPAGKGLDQDKVLGTKALHPYVGQSMLCSIYCRVSLACRGFLVSDAICKTFSELEIVTDASVSL